VIILFYTDKNSSKIKAGIGQKNNFFSKFLSHVLFYEIFQMLFFLLLKPNGLAHILFIYFILFMDVVIKIFVNFFVSKFEFELLLNILLKAYAVILLL
jgi:hypothetical protein